MTTASQPLDFELGHVRDGYPALATWAAHDPDGETFIFRKFTRLAARNVLHLQAQLIALEREIDVLDEEARTSNDSEARQASRRWETLMQHAENPNRSEHKRVEKLNKLKECLRKYHETIVLQSQVMALQKPERRPLNAFRDFLGGASINNGVKTAAPLISGRAKEFLNDADDLVALTSSQEDDYLSQVLQNHWFLRKRTTIDPFDRTAVHKDMHIVQTVAVLGMTLAAVLLVGAIVNLYLVCDAKAKLGLVAMYTLLFTLSIALCTNARRVEVFAATAAYAAVLIVFVSGDLGGTRNEQCTPQIEQK